MRDLSGYTDFELQEECRRRREERAKSNREAAFKCCCCGQIGYFYGTFSPALFERQYDAFHALHLDCLPLFNGGGI